MKYLKLFENMDIDPFDEEDWNEVEEKEHDIEINKPGLIMLHEKGKGTGGWKWNVHNPRDFVNHIIENNPKRE